MGRKALAIYDLFRPPTGGTQVSDEKKLKAGPGGLLHLGNCFTSKRMKLVGEAVPAKEEAAVPSQTAEDSHGK